MTNEDQEIVAGIVVQDAGADVIASDGQTVTKAGAEPVILRTASTDRLHSLKGAPAMIPGHARAQSESTLVNSNPSSPLGPSFPNVELKQSIQRSLSVRNARLVECRGDTASLRNTVAVPETKAGGLDQDLVKMSVVQNHESEAGRTGDDSVWEKAMAEKHTSHENVLAKLREDYEVQIKDLQKELKSAITAKSAIHKHRAKLVVANQGIQEQKKHLETQYSAVQEQLAAKDETLQHVVAEHQALQGRFELSEVELKERQQVLAATARFREMVPSLEIRLKQHEIALKETLSEKERLQEYLYSAQQVNISLLAKVVSVETEAEERYDRMQELASYLEGKPLGTAEMNRIIEYKDHMHAQLEKRVDKSRDTLEELQKKSKHDRNLANAELSSLKDRLRKQSNVLDSLRAGKEALQHANTSLLDVLKRPVKESELLQIMDEHFQVTKQDNFCLTSMVQKQLTENSDAYAQIAVLERMVIENESANLESQEQLCKLQDEKASNDIEIGRLEMEVDVLPRDQRLALEAKDAVICQLERKVEVCVQDKKSSIRAGASESLRVYFESMEQDIMQLKGNLDEGLAVNHMLLQRLEAQQAREVQTAGNAMHLEEIAKNDAIRLYAAEGDSRNLRKQLSNLREFHNPLRNAENLNNKDGLRTALADLRKLEQKLDDHKSLSSDKKQRKAWDKAFKYLIECLLARIIILEDALYFDKSGHVFDRQCETVVYDVEGNLVVMTRPLIHDDTSEAGSPVVLNADQLFADLRQAREHAGESGLQPVSPLQVVSHSVGNDDDPYTRAQKDKGAAAATEVQGQQGTHKAKSDQDQSVNDKTDAQVAYDMVFPHGHQVITTSRDGLLCGFAAVAETMWSMFRDLAVPTIPELQEIRGSQEFRDHGRGFGMDNENNFTIDQVGAVLFFWGRSHGLNLRIGYIIDGQEPQLLPHANDEQVIIVWVHNDNGQSLSTEGASALGHFSGVKPLPKVDDEDSFF